MPSLSETAYKAIFETAPIGDVVLSMDFIILDVNRTFLKSAGRQWRDLVGRSIFDVFPENPGDPEDTGVAALRKSLARVVATGEPDTLALQRYPIPIKNPDGTEYFEERFWSVVNTPFYDRAGNLAGISHSSMDVTDLVRMEGLPESTEPEKQLAEANMFTRTQALQQVKEALEEERERLRHLFERAPGFVYFTEGEQHVVVQANEAFHELTGWREVIGKSVEEAFPDIAGQGFYELHNEVYRTGQPYVGSAIPVVFRQLPFQPPSERIVDIVYQPIVDASGTVVGICGQGNDITEKRLMEAELRASEERWKLALEASGGGMWEWNPQTRDVRFSHTWRDMLGYSKDEVEESFDAWQRMVYPKDLKRVLKDLDQLIRAESQTFSSEYRIRRQDGGWMWVLARGAVVGRDLAGRPTRVIGTNIDISESKQSERKIWLQANFDALTGLPNRRLFRDRLEQATKKARRGGHSLALLFIDLDRFKEVNDLLGHDAGDLLLADASRRISACMRESDTVARLGGDEFTTILTPIGEHAHIEEIACKIIEALSAPFRVGQDVVHISASIGITLFPQDASEPSELIRNADQAMYFAKKAGRDQFRYFTRSMQEQAQARLGLGRDLRRALAENEFRVVYQPVIDLSSGRIVKAEALIRWHHPSLGLVAPADFIPLAEELGLIQEIGDWVFKQAVACSKAWSRMAQETFEISVNRSPVQFMSKSSNVNWPRYLMDSGLSGDNISVEITESMLIDASPDMFQTLLEYRDAGIQVALDDFGTGYSSLAYLKKFDIDYLKIDRSFVRDMVTNDTSRAIARSTIVMAHELGLKVIAEGIETQDQMELLAADGCDYGQGFLFSEPVPPEKFERLLVTDWATLVI